MAMSLHTVVVGAYQQMLPQAARLIDKAEAHCEATETRPEDLARACLAPDMWPFANQIYECAYHSAGAIVAVRNGAFSADRDPAPTSFAGMRQGIAQALELVNSVDPAELDSLAEKEVLFRAGKFDMTFTAANFLTSFSLPNFYFHTTTAYNILRMSGVKLGKPDFLGRLRSKG